MSQQPYLMRSLFWFFDHGGHVSTTEKFNKDSRRNSRGLEQEESMFWRRRKEKLRKETRFTVWRRVELKDPVSRSPKKCGKFNWWKCFFLIQHNSSTASGCFSEQRGTTSCWFAVCCFFLQVFVRSPSLSWSHEETALEDAAAAPSGRRAPSGRTSEQKVGNNRLPPGEY